MTLRRINPLAWRLSPISQPRSRLALDDLGPTVPSCCHVGSEPLVYLLTKSPPPTLHCGLDCPRLSLAYRSEAATFFTPRQGPANASALTTARPNRAPAACVPSHSEPEPGAYRFRTFLYGWLADSNRQRCRFGPARRHVDPLPSSCVIATWRCRARTDHHVTIEAGAGSFCLSSRCCTLRLAKR